MATCFPFRHPDDNFRLRNEGLRTNPLSNYWKEHALDDPHPCPKILGPAVYLLGMVGYALSLITRVLGVVKDALFLIGSIFYSIAKCNFIHTARRFVILMASISEVFIALIGIVCPVLAYSLDERLYCHQLIYRNSILQCVRPLGEFEGDPRREPLPRPQFAERVYPRNPPPLDPFPRDPLIPDDVWQDPPFRLPGDRPPSNNNRRIIDDIDRDVGGGYDRKDNARDAKERDIPHENKNSKIDIVNVKRRDARIEEEDPLVPYCEQAAALLQMTGQQLLNDQDLFDKRILPLVYVLVVAEGKPKESNQLLRLSIAAHPGKAPSLEAVADNNQLKIKYDGNKTEWNGTKEDSNYNSDLAKMTEEWNRLLETFGSKEYLLNEVVQTLSISSFEDDKLQIAKDSSVRDLLLLAEKPIATMMEGALERYGDLYKKTYEAGKAS